jgi:hypothetical protein
MRVRLTRVFGEMAVESGGCFDYFDVWEALSLQTGKTVCLCWHPPHLGKP